MSFCKGDRINGIVDEISFQNMFFTWKVTFSYLEESDQKDAIYIIIRY